MNAGPDGYDVILADPPWSYHGSQTKPAAAAKHYDTMPDDDLLGFTGIIDRLTPRGLLFMWATGPRLDFAMECLTAWGLTFRGVAFVWVKTRRDGTPVGAQGVRPSTVKPTTEFVLAASRVRKGRPLPLRDEAVRQVVLAPRQEHSRKPDEVHDALERMYPDARKLEMFARRARPGWDAWGNQAPTSSAAA